MAKDLFYPGSILSFHRKAADKLIASGSGDAALLYLCLLAGRDAAALKWDPARLEAAHHTLLTLHLADPEAPVQAPPPQKLEPDAPPDYTTQDITVALAQGGFAALVPEVERLLGKVLSPSDLKTLYMIYDFLAMPPEVILTLVSYCVEEVAKKRGPGRKPTLTQIRRTAFRWQKAGVDSLETADAYLRRLARLSSRGMEIMALLGHPDRAPVDREAEYLDAWITMGFDDEALTMAHDRTVFQLGKFQWSYMNGILLSWQKQGLSTAAEIRQAEDRRRAGFTRPAPNRAKGQAPLPSDDIGRMLEEAARQQAQQHPHKEG